MKTVAECWAAYKIARDEFENHLLKRHDHSLAKWFWEAKFDQLRDRMKKAEKEMDKIANI